MKRNGSLVFLMELIIVILFFSLSAVTTLRLFIGAHTTEQKSAQISAALIEAENTAERFRAKGIDMFSEDGWVAMPSPKSAFVLYQSTYIAKNGEIFTIEVAIGKGRSDSGLMESGGLKVFAQDDPQNSLCSLTLGRYSPNTTGEVSP